MGARLAGQSYSQYPGGDVVLPDGATISPASDPTTYIALQAGQVDVSRSGAAWFSVGPGGRVNVSAHLKVSGEAELAAQSTADLTAIAANHAANGTEAGFCYTGAGGDTLTLPAAPADGQVIPILNFGGGDLTVDGGGASVAYAGTIGASQTVSPNWYGIARYSAASGKWGLN